MNDNENQGRLEAINNALHTIRNGLISDASQMAEKEIENVPLSELASKGYVTCIARAEGEIYYLTEKGAEYLTNYDAIVEFTAAFGLA